jgi:HD superfamily phosphodiesterase
VTELVERAAATAQEHLSSSLPRRWLHVKAVASKAEGLASLLVTPQDVGVLVAAAWVHDIGYAPGVADTGLHSLDGARWLLREGYGPRLAGLVAYHSCASYEAEERGLGKVLTRIRG